MNAKGDISLSMNFLVIIIISLVVFGLGIALLYNLLGSAEEFKQDLDARTEQELERLLIDQGQKVALPRHSATVQRGETYIFGIGIRNVGDAEENFRIIIEFVRAVDAQNNEITALPADFPAGWFLYNKQEIVLPPDEHSKEAILVSPAKDVPPGQYIFRAVVRASDGSTYGNPQTFVVNVV